MTSIRTDKMREVERDLTTIAGSYSMSSQEAARESIFKVIDEALLASEELEFYKAQIRARNERIAQLELELEIAKTRKSSIGSVPTHGMS